MVIVILVIIMWILPTAQKKKTPSKLALHLSSDAWEMQQHLDESTQSICDNMSCIPYLAPLSHITKRPVMIVGAQRRLQNRFFIRFSQTKSIQHDYIILAIYRSPK